MLFNILASRYAPNHLSNTLDLQLEHFLADNIPLLG